MDPLTVKIPFAQLNTPSFILNAPMEFTCPPMHEKIPCSWTMPESAFTVPVFAENSPLLLNVPETLNDPDKLKYLLTLD